MQNGYFKTEFCSSLGPSKLNITTTVSEFILHCAIESNQRSIITCILTLIYFTTMFGNLLVILIIILNLQLHAPMYMYIGTLAGIDLTNTSIFIPKMLSVLLLDSSVVSYGACVLQMFLVYHVLEMESLVLAFMAFDRYIAVVYPPRYPSVITNKTVWMGVLLMNAFGVIFKSPFLFFVAELSFCHTNVLPNCLCDYTTMVRVVCTEDPKYLMYLSVGSSISGLLPLTLILFSYSRIVLASIKISSVDGKRKIFSTCLTHLMVVGIFYTPLSLSYILPGIGVRLSIEASNTMVIVGNVIPPMMNPIIYSFRNQEIKSNIYRIFTGRRTNHSVNLK